MLRQVNYVPLSGGGNVIPQLDDYTYDALNRITSVTEAQQNSGGTWTFGVTSQTFTYDRWGNRTSVTGQTAQSWSTTEASTTNRLKLTSGNTCTGTKVGLCYDAAGNLIFDNQLGSGGDRTYDTEGSILTAAGGGTNKYIYDADGRRVRRQVGSAQYWQVYGIGGELVAEYQWNGTTATLQKEYGYRGGQMLIVAESATTVRWLVTDHLGTPRMIADQGGNLSGITRHDYFPFGEENVLGAQRVGNGYQAEGVRQRYTGDEHDSETGLEFAQARYLSSLQGRFTSVDPLHSSAILVDPQSWNRYSYVGNRPLAITDPSGLRWAQQFKDGKTYYQWFGTDDEYNKALQNGWEAVTFDESKSYGYEPYPGAAALQFVLNPDGSSGWNPHADAVVADGSEVAGAFIGGGLSPFISRFLSGLFGEFFGGTGGQITTLGLSETTTTAVTNSTVSTAATATTEATSVTVGRWMSEAEYAAMQSTGMVQGSVNLGVTNVAYPASSTAFLNQASVGSVYVEFNVSASSVIPKGGGWGIIPGPNSIYGRLAAQKGLPLPQMPPAQNIIHAATKVRN